MLALAYAVGSARRCVHTAFGARILTVGCMGTHSDLMPPPPKDAVDDAIRAVSDPKSPMYIRLMDGVSCLAPF